MLIVKIHIAFICGEELLKINNFTSIHISNILFRGYSLRVSTKRDAGTDRAIAVLVAPGAVGPNSPEAPISNSIRTPRIQMCVSFLQAIIVRDRNIAGGLLPTCACHCFCLPLRARPAGPERVPPRVASRSVARAFRSRSQIGGRLAGRTSLSRESRACRGRAPS